MQFGQVERGLLEFVGGKGLFERRPGVADPSVDDDLCAEIVVNGATQP